MPDSNSVPEDLDAVLRKYGKIWIWSILSAAVAALSIRYFPTGNFLALPGIAGSIGRMRNNPWEPFLALLAFIPSLGTLAAVYFLLQFLRHHILPILFPAPPARAAEPAQESQNFTLTGAPAGSAAPAPVAKAVPDGARLLFNALAAVVIAMALEAVEALFSIVYRAVV